MKTAVFVMMAFLVMVSLAFAQAPTGLEPVRNDAPTDKTNPRTRLHEYTVYRGTPVVDGDINDAVWQQIPFTECDLWQVWDGGGTEEEYSDNPEYTAEYDAGVTFPNWLGPEDAACRFKMLWDDDNVYFVTVQDDDAYQEGPNNILEPWKIWEGDNVQVGVDIRDPNTGGGLRADSPADYAEAGWAIVLFVDETYYGHWNATWVNPETGAETVGGEGWPLELAPGTCDSPNLLANGHAIHGTNDAATNRVTFELAVMKWFGVEAGAAQMMSLIGNDGDPAGVSGDLNGRQGAIQWGGGIINPKDSGKYGSILFSDQGAPATSVESSTWGKIKSTF